MSHSLLTIAQSKTVKVETARQTETSFLTTFLSHDDELSGQTEMSCLLPIVSQSKTLKVETTRQAKSLSKPLLYLTTLNYQARLKPLFSAGQKECVRMQ